MHRILMNNTGSQAVDIINLLHKANHYIVYLSAQNNKKIEDVADIYLQDMSQDTKIEEYIDFLIDICKNYQIEAFIPFRRMEEIASYKEVFENHQIKVMLPSNVEMFQLLNDKAKTYELLQTNIKEYIPEYYVVNNLQDLKIACDILKTKNKTACMKYVTDISSNSFRIIDFCERTLAELEVKSPSEKNKLRKTLTYQEILQIFKNGIPKPLLIMEYMEGREVSCDCLKLKDNRKIIIPRIKYSDRHQKIVLDETLLKLCNTILDETQYDTICNIQFKYLKDKPLLLEINTRMSGGIMIACNATNINLPTIAIADLFDEQVYISNIVKNVDITQQLVYNYSKIND